MKRLVLLALVCVILLGVTPAGADDPVYVIGGGGGVGTKISKLPYTISAPGFYYLDRNLHAASGNGILINSDNGSVTLDLMGFSLSGTAGNKGIYSTAVQTNIEVRNGTLRAWEWGIDLPTDTETCGIRVINVRVFGCNSGGIRVGGASGASLVKGCMVSNCLLEFGIQNNRGAIIGNTVSNCFTAISLRSGSIVGNNILCNGGQTGISLPGDVAANYILIDQNTVNGDGTHYSGPGANTVKYGHNSFQGVPPPSQ